MTDIRITTHKDPIKPTVEAIEDLQRNVDYWAERCIKAEHEIERLRAAAEPFAEWGWYDAEQEDNNCQLVRHSGPITVGHWRALRAALGMKP